MGGGVGPLAGVLLARLPAVTTTCRGERIQGKEMEITSEAATILVP